MHEEGGGYAKHHQTRSRAGKYANHIPLAHAGTRTSRGMKRVLLCANLRLTESRLRRIASRWTHSRWTRWRHGTSCDLFEEKITAPTLIGRYALLTPIMREERGALTLVAQSCPLTIRQTLLRQLYIMRQLQDLQWRKFSIHRTLQARRVAVGVRNSRLRAQKNGTPLGKALSHKCSPIRRPSIESTVTR